MELVMNPDAFEDDMIVMMRLRRIKTRDACLFLFPRAFLSMLIVVQQLLQIVAFYFEGVPGKVGGLLIRSGWQLPLTLLGISSSSSLQHASTAISSLFCYFGIVVISVARLKSDLAEVKQWRRASRHRTTYNQQPGYRMPFHIAVPSWLEVVDIAYAPAPSAPGDQHDEEVSQPPHASQAEEQQVVDSTLTFVYPTGEREIQQSLPAIPTARIESSTILAATLAVDHSYDTSDTVIAPTSDIDVKAVADSIPGGDEVAVSQETLLIEISFLIEIGQDISIFVVAKSDAMDVQIEVRLNRMYQALLVHLALGDEGERWVKHTELYKMICSDRGLHYTSNVKSKAVRDAFNQAMSRMRLALQKALDQAVQRIYFTAQATSAQVILRILGMMTEDGKQPKLTDEGIVFQNKIWARDDSRWCLSPAWRVRQFEHLTSVYEAIKDAQSDPSNKGIPIKTLREMIDQVRDEYWGSSRTNKRDREAYVGGFLISVLRVEAFADWVPRHYKRYRKMFLFVLKYAAKREYKLGNWNRAGVLYLECIHAASYPPVDAVQGKRSLLECLSVYVENDDDERAERIYRLYEKRMRKVDADWEPDAETAKFLREKYILEVED
jgi:hypothetical protein